VVFIAAATEKIGAYGSRDRIPPDGSFQEKEKKVVLLRTVVEYRARGYIQSFRYVMKHFWYSAGSPNSISPNIFLPNVYLPNIFLPHVFLPNIILPDVV
jgi:hypothetical protein